MCLCLLIYLYTNVCMVIYESVNSHVCMRLGLLNYLASTCDCHGECEAGIDQVLRCGFVQGRNSCEPVEQYEQHDDPLPMQGIVGRERPAFFLKCMYVCIYALYHILPSIVLMLFPGP